MKQNTFESSFDTFAELYNTVRPAYPNELFEDIRVNCNIEELSDILEIGTGTGIATRQLLQFSLPVTTIEPGKNLLDIAKRNLKDYPDISFVHSTFEEFKATRKYDMIFSATSFHWLNKEKKYQIANNILSDKGFLVLVWNNFLHTNEAVYKEIDTLYRKYLPELSDETDVNIKSLNKLLEREMEISASDLFYITFSKKYISKYVYSVENYAGLLNTFPEIIKLKDVEQKLFLSEIRQVVDRYNGITVPVMSSVYICRKKDVFTE